MAKRLARASAQARQEPQLRRLRFEVSSLVVDPKRPRVAAGRPCGLGPWAFFAVWGFEFFRLRRRRSCFLKFSCITEWVRGLQAFE